MSTMKEFEMGKNLTSRPGEALETAPVVECMKKMMMVFNIIFLLSGAAVLGLGVWTHEDLMTYLRISSVYQPGAPYVLIAIGSVAIPAAGLSCFFTRKGRPMPLYVMSAVLGAVFLAEFGCSISILVENEKLHDGFTEGLTEAMDNYKDHNDLIDKVQLELSCCGITTYTDWYADRNVTSTWEKGQKFTTVPESCCKAKHPATKCHFEGPFPKWKDDLHDQGCREVLVDFMGGKLGPIGGASLGISFFTGLGGLLAFLLGKSIDKATYEQVD